jgi:hypothetical protein
MSGRDARGPNHEQWRSGGSSAYDPPPNQGNVVLKLTFCLRRLPSLLCAAQRPAARDEAKFIDLAKSPLWLNRGEMIYGELRRAS